MQLVPTRLYLFFILLILHRKPELQALSKPIVARYSAINLATRWQSAEISFPDIITSINSGQYDLDCMKDVKVEFLFLQYLFI